MSSTDDEILAGILALTKLREEAAGEVERRLEDFLAEHPNATPVLVYGPDDALVEIRKAPLRTPATAYVVKLDAGSDGAA
jgi:hypothetical protein